jgi:hypothetical protein
MLVVADPRYERVSYHDHEALDWAALRLPSEMPHTGLSALTFHDLGT